MRSFRLSVQRGADLLRAAGLALLWLCAAIALRADTVLTTTNPVVLQLALNAGGVVRFNFTNDTTFHLATNLVISTNVTVDGGERVVFDGGGSFAIVTNTASRSNDTFTITVTNVTVTASNNGSRLFAVNSNAHLSLLNLALINGHATNGGAILNRGALVVSNCFLAGNAAVGRAGANGSNGSTNLYGNGGDGDNGGNGGNAQGGAICNYGSASVFRTYFLTNVAVGGNGGTGGSGGDGAINAGQGGSGGTGGSALGGSIHNSGTLALRDCELDVSYAIGGAGGAGGAHGAGLFNLYNGLGGAGGAAHGAGIYNTGLLNPTACTLARNGAKGGDSAKGGTDPNSSNGSTGVPGGASFGGGVCNLGTNTMINCTVFTNYVLGGLGGDGGDGSPNAGLGGAGGAASGGDLYNSGRTVATNCTIAYGSSYGGFGGLPGAGLFAATNGANGTSRGANLGNNSGAFILKNSILAYPVSRTNSYGSTNLTYTTNITGLTTNWSTTIDPRTGQTITNGISGYTTNYGIVTTTNVIGITNIAVGLNGSGTFTDAGYNLSSDGSLTLANNGLANTDPRLEPLTTNGGFTLTMALGLNSPAINRGDTNTGSYLATDQRGQPRVQGGRADIGAYESAVIGLFTLSGGVVRNDNDAPLTNVLLTVTNTFVAGNGATQTSVFTALTGTNGAYRFTNMPGGDISLVASRTRFRFLPPSNSFTLTNDQTVNFRGIPVFSISGTVTLDGAGMEGVLMSAGTEGTDDTTDASGSYTISNLDVSAFTNYEVDATLDGYSFSPEYINVPSGPDVTNVNFTAFGGRAVSGRVLNSANQGVSNVIVVVGSDYDVTDSNGNYSVTNLLPDIYAVIPFASDYSFAPSATNVNVTASNAIVIFRTVSLNNISGRVTNSAGAGVSDVIINTTASGSSSPTGPDGYFSLSSVATNSQITPSRSGYSFTPPFRLLSASDPTNLTFYAWPSLTISGQLTEGTNAVTNLVVTATGAVANNPCVTNSVASDANGSYTLADLPPGAYTVAPTNVGAGFSPPSTNVTLTTTNLPGVNFTAKTHVSLLRTNSTGPFQLTLTGLPAHTYKIQTTTNLSASNTWQLFLSTNADANGAFQTSVTNTTNPPRLFLRWTTP